MFASDNESIGEIDDEEAVVRNSDDELDRENTHVDVLEETDEASEDVGDIQIVQIKERRGIYQKSIVLIEP